MKKLFFILLLLFSITLFSQNKAVFDIQGHRGCRALMPENSIPAFIKAVQLGVTALELDVVVSKDKKVVVSHDVYISKDFCRTANCNPLSDSSELNIYKLNYDEIRDFDCGCAGNPKYPSQKHTGTYKPLLQEVIDTVENFIKTNHLPPVQYNIEIKSKPEYDNELAPAPKEYVNLVYQILKEKNITERTIIQSFDPRALNDMHNINSELKFSLLVMNFKSFKKNLKKLKFLPDIYSPYYKLVSRSLIKNAHLKNIKVIPWTVNDKKKINKLQKKGIDGIITDDPEILTQ